MYQMSCNRSAGTGENQIIWCGWAAAAGKRCGRAAGGLPASLRRRAEGLPAPAALPPRPARLLLPLRAGASKAGRVRRLRGARPSPAKRRSPGRYLRAPRGPTASRPRCRLRAGSAACGGATDSGKACEGERDGADSSEVVRERSSFWCRFRVSPSSSPGPGAGKGNQPLPASLPPGPSRTCGSRGSPPAGRAVPARSESDTRQPGRAAPAEAAGCEQRGFRQRART